jgi:hypothetical protein
MTTVEFDSQWLRMVTVFGPASAGAEQEYLKLFHGYSLTDFRAAVDIVLSDARFRKIPLPKEIFNALTFVNSRKGMATIEDIRARDGKCRYCGGGGWVQGKPILENTMEYSCVVPCRCAEGRRRAEAWIRIHERKDRPDEQPQIYDRFD